MKKKIPVILILALFVTTSILPVSGIESFDKKETERQNQFDEQKISSTIGDNVDWRFKYRYDPHCAMYSINEKKDFESMFHPRELIIKFKEDTEIYVSTPPDGIVKTGISSIDALNEKFGVICAEKLFEKFSIPRLSIYKFIFSDDVDVYRTVKEYSLDSSVEYAEPNYIYHLSPISNSLDNELPGLISKSSNSNGSGLIPNDPFFDEQWALNQSNDCDIDAPEAWQIETGSADVVVAIIDSGVDYNHEDLAGNIWINTDEIPDNGVDDDDNGFIDDVRGWDFVNDDNDPNDDYGHGTFCGGIAATVTNNSIGIAGVSWKCQILPIKTGDKIGKSYVDDDVKGIYYAVDNDADIISMSWGGYWKSNLLYETVNYAYEQGVVLVAAAGNDDTSYKASPARYDEVIAVAATGKNDDRAHFGGGFGSNYGRWIDVAAPGVDILSTFKGNKYGKGSGTSASCPHVAGLAALLLSKHNHCPYPAQMVKSVIPYTTDEIETDEYIGSGRINAYKLLTQQPFAVDLETIPGWEDSKGTIDITGTVWGEGLQYFALEIGQNENPSSWTELLNSSISQSGVLLSIDSTSLAEGLHTLRLKVVYTHGVFTEEKLMYVNNEADGSYDAEIYVSNCYDSSTSGWGITHFDNIQHGIDKAKIGDTIFVHDGVYLGDIRVKGFSKSSISLIGQSKNWTIIEGCINITYGRKVTISGFTIREGLGNFLNLGYYEILLSFSKKCTIADCNIDNYYNFYNSNTFIVWFSSNNIIRDNNITGVYGSGPIAVNHFCSYKTEISGNTMINHGIGIALNLGHSNIISRNNIANSIVGIQLGFVIYPTRNNLIYQNEISYADFGIYLWGGVFNNKIIANSFTDSLMGIVGEMSQGANNIYYNNFERNLQSAADFGVNLWYKPEGIFNGKGNYWDDYNGVDSDGDGIGDTPYKIPDRFILNMDRFPFMKPVDIDDVEVEEFINEIINEDTKQSNQQYSNMWFLRWLERFPILNQIVNLLIERWI